MKWRMSLTQNMKRIRGARGGIYQDTVSMYSSPLGTPRCHGLPPLPGALSGILPLPAAPPQAGQGMGREQLLAEQEVTVTVYSCTYIKDLHYRQGEIEEELRRRNRGQPSAQSRQLMTNTRAVLEIIKQQLTIIQKCKIKIKNFMLIALLYLDQ